MIEKYIDFSKIPIIEKNLKNRNKTKSKTIERYGKRKIELN